MRAQKESLNVRAAFAHVRDGRARLGGGDRGRSRGRLSSASSAPIRCFSV